jgi:hypothetical protein
MADAPEQAPATPPQKPPTAPAAAPLHAESDLDVRPATAEEATHGVSAASDLDVQASTPAEASLFKRPQYGPGQSGYRPPPHPFADLFSAVTTGLGIAGGMMAGPEIAGGLGLGALSDAAATGANTVGRTVLPFLTRTAWRIPAAAAGAVTGYLGGKAAAMPAGGPPPKLSDLPEVAKQEAEGEAGGAAITAGLSGTRNVIAAGGRAPDVVAALLKKTPAAVQRTVGPTAMKAANAVAGGAAPFARRTNDFMAEQYGGPPISGVQPTPAQIHPGRIRAFSEGIGRLSAVSTDFAKADAANDAVVAQAADGLVSQFGPRTSPESAGTLIRGKQAGAIPKPGVAPPALTPDLTAAQSAADTATAQATAARARATGIQQQLTTTAGPRVGPEATGTFFQGVANAAEQAARDVSAQLYKKVDTLAGGAAVSLDPLGEAADAAINQQGPALEVRGGKLRSTLKRASAIATPPEETEDPGLAQVRTAVSSMATHAGTPGAADIANPRVKAILDQAAEAAKVSLDDIDAGTITFGQAHELRSELGKQSYLLSRSADPHAANDQRLVLQLKDAVDGAMTTAAGGKDTPLRQAYDTATTHYRDVVGAYSDGILAKSIEAEPRLVTDTLIKPGRVAEIADLWKHVTPQAQQAVQGQWLHDLLANPDGSPRTPEAIAKTLKQWPIETLGALFNQPTAHLLQDLGPAVDQAVARETAAGVAQKALTTAGKSATGAVETAQSAQQAYAQTVAKVNSQSAPKVFASMLPKADVETAQKTRALVGEADWAQIQSAHVQRLLYNETGQLKTPKQLETALGPERLPTLGVIYGPRNWTPANGTPEAVQSFQRLARTVSMLSGDQKAGLGLMMRIGQGGALFGLATAAAHFAFGQPWEHAALEGGGVLLGPAVVARIMTNPAARQWLTTGLEAKAMGDTTRWTRMSGQLGAWLINQGLVTPPTRTQMGQSRPGVPGLGGRAGGPPPMPAPPAGQPPPSLGGRGGG